MQFYADRIMYIANEWKGLYSGPQNVTSQTKNTFSTSMKGETLRSATNNINEVHFVSKLLRIGGRIISRAL